ncbi:hypothetical protein R1flu_019507 [Riccia fluitans]|uniref:Uncharacterized protein n=1 Tax=Riccia fluitans TaxID=41844 RepID=A0ABD1ZMN7_9MARC
MRLLTDSMVVAVSASDPQALNSRTDYSGAAGSRGNTRSSTTMFTAVLGRARLCSRQYQVEHDYVRGKTAQFPTAFLLLRPGTAEGVGAAGRTLFRPGLTWAPFKREALGIPIARGRHDLIVGGTRVAKIPDLIHEILHLDSEFRVSDRAVGAGFPTLRLWGRTLTSTLPSASSLHRFVPPEPIHGEVKRDVPSEDELGRLGAFVAASLGSLSRGLRLDEEEGHEIRGHRLSSVCRHRPSWLRCGLPIAEHLND